MRRSLAALTGPLGGPLGVLGRLPARPRAGRAGVVSWAQRQKPRAPVGLNLCTSVSQLEILQRRVLCGGPCV